MIKQHLLPAFALVMVSFSAFSQAAAEKGFPKDTVAPEVRYTKLKALYIKYQDSKTYQAADSLFQLYTYKLTPEVELKDIRAQGTDYLSWAKANLSKTEFKDYAEAEKLSDEFNKALTASTEANREYYDYLSETIQLEGGVDISMNVTMDVRREYPEKFKRIKLPKRKSKKDFYPKLPGQ
jgi:hypothetical protein